MNNDRELLIEIMESLEDPLKFAMLVHDFYRDLDRAQRTSRETMYLHIGILAGIVWRLESANTKSKPS